MPYQSPLTTVIDRLHKQPQSGQRQALAVSRADAERLPRRHDMAVISITEPGRPQVNWEGINHVLRLSFADVDPLQPNLSRRAEGKLDQAFTLDQAGAVLKFVEALPPDVVSVVVQCEGGRSRSCGVVLALHRRYGMSVHKEQLTQANSFVANLVQEASPAVGSERSNQTKKRVQWPSSNRLVSTRMKR